MTNTSYIIDGTITDYDEQAGILTIQAPFTDYITLVHREVKKVKVQLIDGRSLSDKQRRTCYALIGAIAE